ncbi:choline/ethanolamine kinase [Plakobranchus ocellatus]|uniref:Choline/ethanolamine kinase n=1 Tax=Plakobranchus ocellatus TaxID=259542 RepID=A0AAV4A352_9GAST|nr:choline/ethanolamine kinase [Plakobranchus ocellatus]
MTTRRVSTRAELSNMTSENGINHHHSSDATSNCSNEPVCHPTAAKLRRLSTSDDSQDNCNDTDRPIDPPNVQKSKDVVTDDIVRRKAFRWCQDSIGGAWLNVMSENELIITHISGGMSNYLYLIALPPGTKSVKGEPVDVLLRIYGQISKSTLDFLVHNSVVFALLAERNLGPKPFGMYHDGRIEEFIKGRPLVPTDLCKPEVMNLVAEKLARFHTLDMPLCKKPRWFKSLVRGWIKDVKNNLDKRTEIKDALQKMSPNFDLEAEYKELLRTASNLNCPVVFCHNDLQGGNVLLADQASGSTSAGITIIDWEYAHYNYRGFDLGNHFNEWMFDYSSTGKPGFEYNFSSYPSREKQFHFFRAYLKAAGCLTEVKDSDLWSLYRETNTLALHSHFLWGVWALVQSLTSSIEFDYVVYSMVRFEAYFDLKAKLPQMLACCES